MLNRGVNKQRKKELLQILLQHGPLSIEALSYLTKPKQSVRGVRKSLALLKKDNFVQTLLEGRSKYFYQISNEPKSLEAVGEILSTRILEKDTSYLRKRNLSHNEVVELARIFLQHRLPDCKIATDWELKEDSKSEIDWETVPDIHVAEFSSLGGIKFSLALEVELFQKSQKRLVRKFKKSMTQSCLDGVIYICESEAIRSALKRSYKSVLSTSKSRTSNYSDNFILFGMMKKDEVRLIPTLQNCMGSEVNFDSWINTIRKSHWADRRDSDFEMLGIHTQHVDKVASEIKRQEGA